LSASETGYRTQRPGEYLAKIPARGPRHLLVTMTEMLAEELGSAKLIAEIVSVRA
jgi:hypothetical protein